VTEPAVPAQRASHDGIGTADGVDSSADRPAGLASDAGAVPEGVRRLSYPAARADVLPGPVRLGAVGFAGGALAYGVMALLGRAVVKHGPTIDEPLVAWTASNQAHPWAAVIEKLDKIGHSRTTTGAALTAAACLGMGWRDQKWLPPSVLGTAVVVDKSVTLALRRTFRRPGPPASPGGTYPSGGCSRAVFVYGLIAHMLWREYNGTRRGRVWAAGAVAALAFNQAYSRQYLSKHWFTDIISGVLYGGLLLAPFVAAVDSIAGPATPVDRDRGPDRSRPAHSPPSTTEITPGRRQIRLAPFAAGLARWLGVS